MGAELAKALIGFVFLPFLGISLLVVGWESEKQQLYALLSLALLIVAVVFAANVSKVREREWKDWFPF